MGTIQQLRNEVNTIAILHYGIEKQSVMCMEELAELTQQISKQLRGEGDKWDLTEEMADVYICLDKLEKMYNINPEHLRGEITEKLERLDAWIELDKKHRGRAGNEKI